MREWLLRKLVGGRDADAVAGDLRESGATGWAYWRQALSCFRVRLSPHRRMIPDLRMDLRMALRNIRHNPGYGLTAMLCLGLALGVNATLFSFLDSIYFRRLPVPDAGRLVRLQRQHAAVCTWQEYLDLRDRLHSLEAAGVFHFGGSADIERLNLFLRYASISANYSRVLRLGTALGRWFGPDADSPSAAPEVVISYQLWQTRFHGDPGVLGKQILVEESPFRIVGVTPKGFNGELPPVVSDAWIPEGATIAVFHAVPTVNLIGRLAPGRTLSAAAGEMRVWDSRWQSKPNDPLQVVPAIGFAGSDGKRYLGDVLPVSGAVCGLVLLIACVNVANLLLGRAAVRRRETAVRQALGASRGRIFREALTEGFVLAAGGVAFGLIFGYWTGRGLELALPSIPSELYHGVALGIDWRVALLLAAAGLICALLFSIPAAVESGKRGVNAALKGESGGRASGQREVYALAQVALSLALLIGTGLGLRALQHVEAADPGFARDHRLAINLFASVRVYTPREAQVLFTSLLDQARRIPGVVDATLAHGSLGPAPGLCAGKSATGPTHPIATNTVEPNYFQVMSVPILRGRGLEAAGAPEIVVSETMARTWWPGEEALGKTVWTGCGAAPRAPLQVVGVARDTRFALEVEAQPAYYMARQQDRDIRNTTSFALIIQTTGNPVQWSKPLMDLAVSAGPRLRIYEISSLEDADALSYWVVKWRAALVASLGALAILLAAIGLYGVIAYAVSQRTREIGVRMAVGATPGDVQWMVLAQGLRIAALGIAIGLALALATVRLLRGYLYGLSPFDPIAFGGACLAWIAIAMLASWFPSRRAVRVNPLIALKWE